MGRGRGVNPMMAMFGSIFGYRGGRGRGGPFMRGRGGGRGAFRGGGGPPMQKEGPPKDQS